MIAPRFLSPGDKVGVVATAKKVNEKNTLTGIDILKSWGLHVKLGNHVFSAHHQFAGTDEQRVQDLQEMIEDPEIKAIFIVRGGYGSTRIIDHINFDSLFENPKWICGFSDITAFHLHLFSMGIASIHSPMPSFFYTLKEEPLIWLENFIFGKTDSLYVDNHALNRTGKASGKLIGGNLSIICHTIGTPSEIITTGNILFIEDVGEQLYHLDRMMVQLKRGGFLNDLAGLIVGQFTDMKDNEDPFGQNANEIIHGHLGAYDYPVAFNYPIGHTDENRAVPVGLSAVLNIDETGSTLVLGENKTGYEPDKND